MLKLQFKVPKQTCPGIMDDRRVLELKFVFLCGKRIATMVKHGKHGSKAENSSAPNFFVL